MFELIAETDSQENLINVNERRHKIDSLLNAVGYKPQLFSFPEDVASEPERLLGVGERMSNDDFGDIPPDLDDLVDTLDSQEIEDEVVEDTFDATEIHIEHQNVVQSNVASDELFYRTARLANGREIQLRTRTRFSYSRNTYKRTNYGVDISGILRELEVNKQQHTRPNLPKAKTDTGELWAEKWRARKWVDLIGDERTHRAILRWLQAWSHAVFRKPVKNSEDKYGRPAKKILMLHGPPGLGKTTAAHVAARQAGYDVLEINASDERAGPVVEAKIRGALDSHRVGAGARPVCIIVDEIDGGVESGFIRVLVDILNSDAKHTKKKKVLLRPIIAICNDPYVAALRTLRPMTELINCRRAPTQYIVARLKEICACEKVKIDSRTLTELVEAMDGDVRACVNSLQFDRENGSDEPKTNLKDVSVNANVVASNVFHSDNASEVMRAVECSGEFEKIMTSCFTLYPNMQYADHMKAVEAGEWLHFYDVMHQNRDLTAYMSLPVAAFRMFSHKQNPPVKIEKTDFEAFEALRSNTDLAKQAVATAPANTRRTFGNTKVVALELAPYLVHIINPGLTTAKSEYERGIAAHAASVMIDFDIKFVQKVTDTGVYVYCMEPPLDRLAVLQDNRAAVGKYLVRQLIAQELERALLRHHSQVKAADLSQKAPGLKRPREQDSATVKKPKVFFRTTQDNGEHKARMRVERTTRVWVQFHDGYSNAVRKPLSWNEFWRDL